MTRVLVKYEYVVPGHGCAHVLCLGAGRWQDANKSTYGAVREILEAHTPEARKTKLDAVWAIFIEWHSDDVLLSHPNYRPYEGESKLVYKPPIMDISTAAYDDVELIMNRIEEELIEEKGMNAVLCVGDQQTFSRTCGILSWLTRRSTSGSSLAVVISITSSTSRRGCTVLRTRPSYSGS